MTRDEALDLMYIAFNKSMCESARRMRDDLLIGADGAWREPEHIAEAVHDFLNGRRPNGIRPSRSSRRSSTSALHSDGDHRSRMAAAAVTESRWRMPHRARILLRNRPDATWTPHRTPRW